MAFDVTLYTFSKRKNSTAKPTGGTVFTGLMREPCGVIRPSVSFEFAAGVNPSAYNYAYIPTFGRYYFINEWTSVGRLWVCSMEVDALASWKTEIGASRQYILRSASDYDEDIVDTLYPTKVYPDVSSEYVSFDGWSYSFASGTYVFGVISPSAVGVGSSVYYVMTSEQFRRLVSYLLDGSSWIEEDTPLLTEIGAPLVKSLHKPLQYVTSCMWLPITITGTPVTSIKFGLGWEIPLEAQYLSGSMLYGSYASIDVPPHPDAKTLGNYCHSAPLSSYELDVPPFGRFPLDANLASRVESLDVEVNIDAVTGIGRLQVRGSGYTFVDVSTQVGVPMQLAEQSIDLNRGVTAASNVSTAVTSALSGGFSGFAGSALSGIEGALTFAKNAQTVYTGATGSNATLGPMKITGVFYRPVDSNAALFGRPLCQTRQINTLTGYIIADRPSVAIPCTTSEREMIETLIGSGFFYE